jgi:pyroglutamyl-peptidase
MAAPKKSAVLLVTAFEPFDGATTNASLILLEKLKEMDWDGRVVFFGPVPVSFDDAWPLIRQEMERHPDLQGVLALGQAEGRSRISLERLALNWIDAGIPDNYGVMPVQQPVEEGAPDVLWSQFPWHELEKSPCWQRSYSAGAYVCNATMYHLLNWARKEDKAAGFVHIPALASQDADPGLHQHSPRMDDDLALQSLRRIIQFSLEAIDPAPGIRPGQDFIPPHHPDGPRPAG